MLHDYFATHNMSDSKYLKKYLLYLLLLVPFILILIETILLSSRRNIRTLSNSNQVGLEYKTRTKHDPITGWKQNCNSDLNNIRFPKELICNRHGLIKTPYQSNKRKNDTFGVLLLGNSVAMGEGLYSRNNRKTFASQLEFHLRKIDKSIDLVNGAYSGYNTWQEHLESFRYVNSEPFHDDLPRLDMIVSFGGIQDFWHFLRLINTNDTILGKEYYRANGMLLNNNSIDYIDKVTSIFSGNIKSGANALLASIASRSNLVFFVKRIYNELENNAFYPDKTQFIVDFTTNKYYKSLDLILANRFNVSFAEYKKIRDYHTSSVVRNIKSNSILIEDPKRYIYIYAPTYFSTINNMSKINIPVLGVSHLIGQKEDLPLEIYEKEMQVLEKDYREALIRKLALVKEITVLDYSSSANHKSWFLDYSHFNEFAAHQLSYQVSEDIKNAILP